MNEPTFLQGSCASFILCYGCSNSRPHSNRRHFFCCFVACDASWHCLLNAAGREAGGAYKLADAFAPRRAYAAFCLKIRFVFPGFI